MKPTFTVQEVTPAMASKWLLKNPHNRDVKLAHVARYAHDMAEGRWMENATPVVFDSEGCLIDGQHRLMAIVKSATTQRLTVAKGFPPESIRTMDCGARRTAADQLAMQGHANAKILSTAAQIVCHAKRGSLWSMAFAPSTPEIVEFAMSSRTLAHSATLGKRCSHVVGAGLIAGLHYLFAEKDAELADWFLEKLATGEDLKRGDPVHTLRERLLAERGSHRTMPRGLIVVFCIKSWNATRRKERMSQLRFATDGARAEPLPSVD